MKKLSAFFVMLILIFAAGICVHAADFNVTSTMLPAAEAYKNYSAQIEMVGGNNGYTFEFVSGIKPVGLNFNSDGSVTGIPTTSGFFSFINVKISHVDGTSQTVRFSMPVTPKKVKVTVSAPDNIYYDGDPHTASVTYYDYTTGDEITDATSKVTYGTDNLTEAVDAGTYYINVWPPSGCMIEERTGSEHLVINKLAVSSLTVSDRTFDYDGQPHGMTDADVTVSPAAAGYIVEYRKAGESEYTTDLPVASGVYSVRAHTTNQNYETMYATATLTIVAQGVKFTVTNTTAEYDGNGHEVTVECDTPAAGYTVSYTDVNGNPVDGKPINAGTYKVVITLTNPDAYTIGNISADTLTITPKTVEFTVDSDTWSFDNTAHTPVITTNPTINSSLYTVKYNKQGETQELTTITDVGTYDIVITLTDSNNYKIADTSSKTITVTAQTVNFAVTNNTYTYNGSGHTATVTPSIEGVGYSVTYTNSKGVTVANPTDAGTYTIGITFDNPNAYSLGTITPNTLVIDPQTVGFTVSDNEMSYDGDPHQATVTPNITISSDAYTVKYRDSKGNLTDSVTNAGVYDIVITVSDTNYVLDSSFSGTMTITSVVSLNIGNSPAAMIYKDSTHANDTEWQAAALSELTTDHKFTSHVPSGCSADITYNLINNIDVDGDKYTVIVKSLDAFSDPGLSVNGTTVSGGTPVQVDGVDGLYKVTYTYDSQSYERYVAVVRRIGDVNGDGNVNAIDATYLDNKDADTNGVTEARVHDVNKDGKITHADALAIRNRFRTKLVGYYPWIENLQ